MRHKLRPSTDDNVPQQHWAVTPVGDGTYVLTNRLSRKAMNVKDGADIDQLEYNALALSTEVPSMTPMMSEIFLLLALISPAASAAIWRTLAAQPGKALLHPTIGAGCLNRFEMPRFEMPAPVRSAVVVWRWKSLLAFALLWGGSLVAWASGMDQPRWMQSPGRVFQHAIEPSLESGYALVQDASGYVWLGTQAGVVRWDGHRAREYLAAPGVPGSLSDSWVRSLLIDQSGTLWIGTHSGGLAHYVPATDSFEQLRDPEGIVGTDVAALAVRPAGGLWIVSNRGVAWLEPSSGRLTSERLPEGVGHAKSLVVARDSTIWLGSDRGLWARRPNEMEFSSIPLGRRENLGHISVLRLLEDAAGRIWAGTHLHGTFTVKSGGEAAEPLRHPNDADLASDTVYALADAGNAEVWIGTYGGGVVRVNMTDGQVHRERHHVARPASLLDDDVGAIFRASDGIVWVATAFGLSRYDTRFDGIWTCYGGPDQTIRDINVPAVQALADGRVVVATGAHGLQILDKDGVSTQLRADPSQPETALPRARVIALASSSDGTVWIGTLGGLYRASPDGRHLRRVAISGRRPSDEIWALQVDGTTLWVGGPDGLWSLDVATAPPAAKHHFDRELGQLHVRALALGMQGELWIGTNGHVFRLDRARTDLRQLHNDPKNPEALMGVAVSSLLVDGRGHLWVATLGQGVQVQVGNLPDGLPKFQRLTTKEGLPHNGVDALILDRDGNVWASTDNGVAQIDPLTRSSRWFRAGHGAGISTFWTGAATLTPDGDLLFGGQGGLLGLRPSKIPRLETSLAPPVITEAQIGSQSMTAAQLVANGEAVVPASVPRLQVEFASLAYSDQDVLRYSYRLEGFDIDWNDSSARGRSASYTKLPSGRYKLQIRVARQNGDWSAPREVALRVEPRWYERIEVQSIACLSVAFLAWYAHHWRLKRAAWRQAQLEDEVRQRTSELEQSRTQLRQLSMHNAQVLEQERARVSRELHDETAQQLAALKLEASMLRQLSSKSGQAEQLPVQNLVDRVDSIIRSIRELVTQLRPPVLDGGISPAIEWLATKFEEQTGVTCELDLQDHGVFSQKEVSTMAFRVVQESLDNIRRHAKATRVCIRMACTEKESSLEIQDNGVGFDAKGSHAGYGLPGMELRVMALGGHFQVASSADYGTTVRVTISTGR